MSPRRARNPSCVLLTALMAIAIVGCGSPSPTRAQVEAWFTKHDATIEQVFTASGLLSSYRSSSSVDCQQIATAATRGLALPPMPVPSLEPLWKSYLVDLRGLAHVCTKGNQASFLSKEHIARATLKQLTELAAKLPAELHQLPAG